MRNGWLRLGRYHLFRARQIQPYLRAVAHPALNLRSTFRLAREAIDHGKAEPAALACSLGSEERLEGTARRVGRHPNPRVGNFYDHIIARRKSTGAPHGLPLLSRSVLRYLARRPAAWRPARSRPNSPTRPRIVPGRSG